LQPFLDRVSYESEPQRADRHIGAQDLDAQSLEAPTTSFEGLGFVFGDPSLLQLALQHRSWCAENGGVESNERLEFLGDAVLDLVITSHLYHSTPGAAEGVLARYRSELVNAYALADLAKSIGLGDQLMLGKGEEATGGRHKTSILADAMEAVIGAIYLDAGIEAATDFVLQLGANLISQVESEHLSTDHKSRLQELAARVAGELPRYAISEAGPEHAKTFSAEVSIAGDVLGHGAGNTKKEAEQAAARLAQVALTEREGTGEASVDNETKTH